MQILQGRIALNVRLYTTIICIIKVLLLFVGIKARPFVRIEANNVCYNVLNRSTEAMQRQSNEATLDATLTRSLTLLQIYEIRSNRKIMKQCYIYSYLYI